MTVYYNKQQKFLEFQNYQSFLDICIDFREIQPSQENTYKSQGIMRFFNGSGCYSSLGRVSTNYISLGFDFFIQSQGQIIGTLSFYFPKNGFQTFN